MFDIISQKGSDRIDRSAHYHYPNEININKAPTDESIKLADEMREKILEKLILKDIKTNDLNVRAVKLYNDYDMGTSRAFLVFSINGKEYKIDFRTPFNGFFSNHEWIDLFRSKLAEAISDTVLVYIIENVGNNPEFKKFMDQMSNT